MEYRPVEYRQEKVEAYDLSLDYVLRTASAGTFQFYSSATHQTHFEMQTVSNAPVEERAGLVSALEWRGVAGLNWRYRNWTVTWSSRYLDSYWANVAHTLNIAQGSAKVSSQIYHDLFVNWAAPASFGDSLLARTEVQIGIRNLFGKDPPFDATSLAAVGGNLYSPLSDPRLRTYLVSLKKTF